MPQVQSRRVGRVHLDEGRRPMRGEPRRLPGARHGVPLIPHAAGVEREGEAVAARGRSRRRSRGDEAGLSIGGEEAAFREEASTAPGATRPAPAIARAPARRTRRRRARRGRRCRNRGRRRSRKPTVRRAPRRRRRRSDRRRRRRSPCALRPRRAIHQSGFASPGSGRKARWREMRRSEFVTVPSFSPQAAAGNSTCAPRAIVSVAITFSETTRRSSWRSASRAPSASGSDTAGFVAMIHSALTRPAAIASNSATALRPSRSAIRGAPQKRRTRSISSGEKPICAASMLARPPTSRPPIAFG